MPHELLIRHVSQLRVVLEGPLDRLPLRWTQAHIVHLAVLDKVAIVAVLGLNYLVYVRRRRGCSVLGTLLRFPAVVATGTRLQLGLLSLLVALTVVVGDLEDFSQAFGWHQRLLG